MRGSPLRATCCGFWSYGNHGSSWCQFRRHLRYQKLSLRQPMVLPMMTKWALWQPLCLVRASPYSWQIHRRRFRAHIYHFSTKWKISFLDLIECPEMFHCPGSYCIPYNKVCDNTFDCPGQEDEDGCRQYMCPGQNWIALWKQKANCMHLSYRHSIDRFRYRLYTVKHLMA